MNKFVVRMLELGSELDKAVSPIQISMVINDAEILYRNHIEQLTIHSVVVPKGTLCDYCKKPLENTCCNDCLEEMDNHNH